MPPAHSPAARGGCVVAPAAAVVPPATDAAADGGGGGGGDAAAPAVNLGGETLALVDFGQVKRLTTRQRLQLARLIVALARADAREPQHRAAVAARCPVPDHPDPAVREAVADQVGFFALLRRAFLPGDGCAASAPWC